MADLINKIKMEVDQALWKNSTAKALDEFAKAAKSVGEKVRQQGVRETVLRDEAKKTTDPLHKRIFEDEAKQAKKKADNEFKVHKQMLDRITEATKLANQKRFREAGKLLKDYYKEQEREATRGVPLSGGLLFGRRGSRVAAGVAGEGGTAHEQRTAMMHMALRGVGGHAAQTAAGILGGGLGSRVYSNLLQGGLIEGGGRSVVDAASYGIGESLTAGERRIALARQNAGAFTDLSGRSKYYGAVGAGRRGGLFLEEAAGFAGQLGRTGASPYSMRGLGLMQSRFGLGGESIGILGAAAKYGANLPAERQFVGTGAGRRLETQEEAQQQAGNRMLFKAVSQGIASGLKVGRLPEFFQAVTSILHGVQPGSKADLGHTLDFLQGLGKAGFKGDQGKAVAQSLDVMAKGGGTPLARAIGLKQLGGFGEVGVNYVEALRKQQRGLFEGTTDKDTSATRFQKLVEGFKDAIPDKETMKFALSEASGLGLDAIDKLMAKMDEGGVITKKDLEEVKPVTEMQKQIEAIGSLKPPLKNMSEKVSDIFEKVFQGKEFQAALTAITTTLPEIAKGIGKIVTATAWLFNKSTEGLGGTASVVASTLTEGPTAGIREAQRLIEERAEQERRASEILTKNAPPKFKQTRGSDQTYSPLDPSAPPPFRLIVEDRTGSGVKVQEGSGNQKW